MELAAVWFAGLLGIVALVVIVRARVSRRARALVVGASVIAIATFAAFGKPRAVAIASGPRLSHDGGYAGSGACRACHPSEHASWSRTFHRTMTQRATPETMLATPQSTSPIVMTTGSHHMQGYWTENASGALHMLPMIYARDEQRLIPRRDAFLQPDDAEQHDVHWETNCIACHATGGRPNTSGEHAITGELGVACEACHGPGSEHIAREKNPFTRYRGARDLAIVNPAKLSPERSTAACGQCHAYSFPRDPDDFLSTGYTKTFHPGDALEASRIILTPAVLADPNGPKLDTDARNLFWPDGTVRVGGREYNAMVLSACYARGEGERKITCLSCHSMHASDPDDQLRRDRNMQDTCISCHKMAANHSHHAPESSGSACVACHMPKTSYALRTAIRSHRIDSPAPGNARPNACNLCHLDRSTTWASTELARLWPSPLRPSETIAFSAPASIIGLLFADAAERVIWADAFGDPAAMKISGADWEAPVLAEATHDPYAVIRFIAARSARAYGASSRSLVREGMLAELAAHRDNRDVFIAE